LVPKPSYITNIKENEAYSLFIFFKSDFNLSSNTNLSLSYYNSLSKQNEDIEITINSDSLNCQSSLFHILGIKKAMKLALFNAVNNLNVVQDFISDVIGTTTYYNDFLYLGTVYNVLSDMNTINLDVLALTVNQLTCTTCS